LEDPLGLLKCGETYDVRFDPAGQRWIVSGLDEHVTEVSGERSYKFHTGTGSNPIIGRISMWGVNFGVNYDGEIFQGANTVVGHVKVVESASEKVKKADVFEEIRD